MDRSRRVVFFDRDGIVNAPPDPERYVTRLEQFRVLPGFIDALRIVANHGWEAVIVTNQKGVSRGCMSMHTVDRIHQALRDRIGREGLRLLDIRVCTAADDDDPRRKPNPGMLREAADRHGIHLSRSWMIGDNERDVLAGARAGCRTVLVRPGAEPTVADFRLGSVDEMAGFLDSHLDQESGDLHAGG